MVTGIVASGARTYQALKQYQPIEVVENVFKTFGTEQCINRISNGFREVEELLANNQTRILERTFRLCFPLPYLDGHLDRMLFFEILATYFYANAMILQEGLIENICEQFENSPVEHDFESLAYVLGFQTIPFPLCYPVSFRREIRLVNDIELTSEYAMNRLMVYQYCTEIGLFLNSGNGTTFFGDDFPIDLLVEMCHALYG